MRVQPDQLHLIVITDRALARPRPVEAVVEAALQAGAPVIQLREKVRTVRETLPLARRIRMATHAAGALFFVNDRLDLALAVGADGIHLGPDDLPVPAARRVVPDDFLLGYSTDRPEEARRAEADGADYIGCGTVWATGSKEDTGRTIGLERLAEVAAAVSVPVVGIGGITVQRAGSVARAGAAGCAVIRAVMGATDPAGAVEALLRPWAQRAT